MGADQAILPARALEDDLWVLDTMHLGEPGVIASYLLQGDDGLALVDVGPAASVDRIMGGVRSAGHDPRDVRHIMLTHVHLDHAGAAGTLARLIPQARVYVHPRGAPHLVDPSRLISSAARIYGVQMQRLWGITEPVPADRIVVLADNQCVRLGRWNLWALHTPGHATHHIAFHSAERFALFAGDVAGVRLERAHYVRPPTPPPDLSLEDWSASIARIRGLDLERMYLPHFGVANEVGAHLSELEARLYAWGEFVLAGMRRDKVTAELTADLARASDPDAEAAAGEPDGCLRKRYEHATNYRMTVQGYERYYRQRHPERLAR
jgi:glyoxylase-like metal-dependent hydrolase (beta-lactamase superfamily II)